MSHWGTPELTGLRATLLCNAAVLILFLNICWWLVLGQDHALVCPIATHVKAWVLAMLFHGNGDCINENRYMYYCSSKNELVQ